MWYIKFNKNQEKERWHRYFAWYPVTVYKYPDGSRKKIWLETVERCGAYNCDWPDCCWEWEYREIKD